MSRAQHLALAALLSLAFTAPVGAATLLAEHVTAGHLDLNWVPGFSTPNNMYAKTLDDTSAAFANPSGDHTVAVAQNASPDSGGIIVTSVQPGAIDADYVWEAYFFTGNGETRRGITVRADPSNDFESFYMLVVEPGLFQIRFRRLIGMTPTTLGSWFANVLPAQSIPPNTWHKLKIIARGDTFRCFFDDFELTTTPIVDGQLTHGWVGVYNFRFDLGNVPVYFDDLTLSCVDAVPVAFGLEPGFINLNSCGRWVKAELTPEPPLTPGDIDVSSIRLNGKVSVDTLAPVDVENAGRTLAVRFLRSDVLLAVPPGDAVSVGVTGLISGGCFAGDDTVRVRPRRVRNPHEHDQAAAGSPLAIQWDTADASSESVAILSSVNDGQTWNVVANGVPNSGTYAWTVPNWPTGTARIAIVEVESVDPADPSGMSVTGTVGVSDVFTITGTLGVAGGVPGFSIAALGNPSHGSLRVSYALPDPGHASLEVYDVTGRQLSAHDVGGSGAGVHTTKLADWVPPGVYVVRLSRAGASVATRITVVR